MQLANFLLSYTKWNPAVGILSVLEKPGRVDWGKVKELTFIEEGYCNEYYYDNGCNVKCRLISPNLCYRGNGGNYAILYSMSCGSTPSLPRNKRKATRIARNMYAAILKDDPRREG